MVPKLLGRRVSVISEKEWAHREERKPGAQPEVPPLQWGGGLRTCCPQIRLWQSIQKWQEGHQAREEGWQLQAHREENPGARWWPEDLGKTAFRKWGRIMRARGRREGRVMCR